MKWKEILNEKLNKGLMLVSVILMVILIGYMHNKHITMLENNITSIYADRLVVNDYIFQLSQIVNMKKEAMKSEEDVIEKIAHGNVSIRDLIVKYENTWLTEDETRLLKKLKDDLSLSVEFENQIIYNVGLPEREKLKGHLKDQYDLIQVELEGLSNIQLSEGKKLLERSGKVMASNAITHRLEIALLIIIMLVFFMVYPSSKKFLRELKPTIDN
ncbi:MAG: hypothetical protein HKN76_22335 [Saprospiraceae bacterium]|nr:hypothetical protein [Saprospiraceae bacterium]